MNELAARIAAHPEWSAEFTGRDRMVVESLVRLAADDRPDLLPLEPSDDGLLAAFLHLARAVRFEHAGLALGPDALATYLARHAAVDGDPASHRAAAEALIATLRQPDRPLAALFEVGELGAPVAPNGAPLVLSVVGDAPAFLHFRRQALAEDRLARRLFDVAQDHPEADIDPAALERALATLTPNAARVARAVADRAVTIVTGGPGTGKTTAVTAALTAIAVAQHDPAPLRVALTAPTARAAARLREAVANALVGSMARIELDERSGTVHRLLGLHPRRPATVAPLDVDVIVVDEASMLELELFEALVTRAAVGTRLVLAGDPGQLASVNVGAALRDVVDAARADGPLAPLLVELTENFRSDPAVTSLAAAIANGDWAALRAAADRHPDAVRVGVLRRAAAAEVRERAEAVQREALSGDPSVALAMLRTHVVLCATREGDASVAWWNDQLGRDLTHRSGALGEFAPGTPVLVTRNESRAWRTALSNGDVGVVVGEPGTSRVLFSTGGAPEERSPRDLPAHEAAFALTIHKSQGSEYDEVMVSLPSRDLPLLTRELLYTAVTRARRAVTVLGDEATLRRTLDRRIARVSAIGERLRALDGGGGRRDYPDPSP